MIEFMVGLLVVVVLLAGLLQLVALASARSEIIGRVRGEAGQRAMTPGALTALPQYLQSWEPGADGRRYTADDLPLIDSPSELRQRIVAQSVADSTDWHWIDERHYRDLAALMDAGLWSAALGFVRADETADVPVIPAIRAWVYHKDSIRVGDEVWLPRTGDLY